MAPGGSGSHGSSNGGSYRASTLPVTSGDALAEVHIRVGAAERLLAYAVAGRVDWVLAVSGASTLLARAGRFLETAR